jgi:hypothetical protein
MMKFIYIIIILIWPILLSAQKGINVTGRVSLRMINTQYDEKSEIKPDTIVSSDYSKTTLIPGFQQNLNLALFARTASTDWTLLGDIRNDPWNELNAIERVNRFSLSTRFGGGHEIVLGDFFESGSEFFVQSREIRGARINLKFERLWNNNSYLYTIFSGGRVERSYTIGDRLRDLYRQYENTGRYRRYLGSGSLMIGDRDLFSLGLHYLYALDDSSSIPESINQPLANQNTGVSGSVLLFKRKIRIFGEGYYSIKDSLGINSVDDYAYKGGIDLRLDNYKLLGYYYRIGYDYLTAGSPYLNNDRQGYFANTAYYFPDIITLFAEGEYYTNNLNSQKYTPETATRIAEGGFTTRFKGYPELTLKFEFQDDVSNTILDLDSNSVKTDRMSLKYEARLAYNFGPNRLSLSGMFIDLDDQSLLAAGTPLGTEQFIAGLNIYSRPVNSFFISGGGVYSHLLMTNRQINNNIYVYESSRWDIIPAKLTFESTISAISNDADNGGIQDMISDYFQFAGELSLEYFFNPNISVKIVGGTDLRHMRYNETDALEVIADPNYGPLFFSSNESYDAVKYGAEINWIF